MLYGISYQFLYSLTKDKRSLVFTLNLKENRQTEVEQNRCAMACQGYGAAILFNCNLFQKGKQKTCHNQHNSPTKS